MNNIRILTLFLFALTLSMGGCKNDSDYDVFDKSPEQRVAELKSEYIRILSAPENGWIGYYGSTNSKGGYTVLLKFDGDRVKIKSEAIDFMNAPETEETITYRIGVKQLPELVFESHALFHRWQDFRDPTVNMLKDGEFQFTFDSIKEDEIILRSKSDLTDPTIFTLRPAKPIDWNFDGLGEMQSLLYRLNSVSQPTVTHVFATSEGERFAELDPTNRLLTIETEEGKAKAHRYALTRNGIRLLEPLRLGSETITDFNYSYAEKTIVSDSPGKLALKKSSSSEVRYFKPQFADELRELAPEAFPAHNWVWAKSPALSNVIKIEIVLKNYTDLYGLEFLPNLRIFKLIGSQIDTRFDLSRNKHLRVVTVLLNPELTQVRLEGLTELQEVLVTGSPLLKSLTLTDIPTLKEVRADLNHRSDFTLILKGNPALRYVRSQQNGLKHLDITGCSGLEELLVNSGNLPGETSPDDSTPTIADLTGLDAKAMPKLRILYIPPSARCGTAVKKFYYDTKAEGRAVTMMFGHALINTPENYPDKVYTPDACP